MNLFLLSWNVNKCAEYHCDKHVVKMVLELTQMLYTSWYMNSGGGGGHVPKSAPVCKSTGEAGYRKLSNPNHPMAKWVRASRWNYVFTVRLACALCLEYAHRYENRTHGCAVHVVWLAENIPPEFGSLKKTVFPTCMPDEYKRSSSPVLSYRTYYVEDKKRFAVWTNRPVPGWFLSL